MVKRGRRIRGGSNCTACTQPNGQTGGKMSGLNPVSLSGGDSFDKSGNSLANQAFGEYLKGSDKLVSLKGQNGGRSKKRGQRRGKGKSAKKSSRRSRSKSRSKSRSTYKH